MIWLVAILLYVCIGAIVTFALYKLHVLINNYSRSTSEYCVTIGCFWPFAAPFAFAIYFAEYGIPEELKRGKEK